MGDTRLFLLKWNMTLFQVFLPIQIRWSPKGPGMENASRTLENFEWRTLNLPLINPRLGLWWKRKTSTSTSINLQIFGLEVKSIKVSSCREPNRSLQTESRRFGRDSIVAGTVLTCGYDMVLLQATTKQKKSRNYLELLHKNLYVRSSSTNTTTTTHNYLRCWLQELCC